MHRSHKMLHFAQTSAFSLCSSITEALNEGVRVLFSQDCRQEGFLACIGAFVSLVDDQACNNERTNLLAEQIQHKLLISNYKDTTYKHKDNSKITNWSAN